MIGSVLSEWSLVIVAVAILFAAFRINEIARHVSQIREDVGVIRDIAAGKSKTG